MGQYTIRNDLAVRDALQRACARREILILATPYLRFESQLLGLTSNEIHARLTMEPEEAIYGLHTQGLKLRFPHGTGFLEARSRFLGLGSYNGIASIRLEIPGLMEDDDNRGAYRVESREPLALTFTDGAGRRQGGMLVNISATGARLRAVCAIGELGLAREAETSVSITLQPDLTVSGHAVVRYIKDMDMGVEFAPRLHADQLEPLNRWIFLRREEERECKARLDREALEAPGADVQQTRCMLLVSGDTALEARLRVLLRGMPPIIRAEPNPTSLKAALDFQPVLLLLHLPEATADAQVRVRLLAESLGGRWPFVLLGTDVENAALFEAGQPLRPAGTFLLPAQGSVFFPRLVQGILNKLEAANRE